MPHPKHSVTHTCTYSEDSKTAQILGLDLIFDSLKRTNSKEACEGGIEGKESEQEAGKAGSERPLL